MGSPALAILRDVQEISQREDLKNTGSLRFSFLVRTFSSGDRGQTQIRLVCWEDRWREERETGFYVSPTIIHNTIHAERIISNNMT
ncbi:hypothetical protein A0H81_03071 [Grifola frondosa]|uniref:Uncharacterized protein n=1 Tax=Grifola frondosa TaxID=5627 RepID=A0A1C7MJB4_GRIFR|nr:hypothetical protein A0H81_03071 [Grifola frondosa]